VEDKQPAAVVSDLDARVYQSAEAFLFAGRRWRVRAIRLPAESIKGSRPDVLRIEEAHRRRLTGRGLGVGRRWRNASYRHFLA